jgi:hypothetical protein
VLPGGTAGGVGGSVVPGAGTGTGAVVGGIAGGIAVMVGVDFLALKLEEEVARETFEADLIRAIDEAERDIKAVLAGR